MFIPIFWSWLLVVLSLAVNHFPLSAEASVKNFHTSKDSKLLDQMDSTRSLLNDEPINSDDSIAVNECRRKVVDRRLHENRPRDIECNHMHFHFGEHRNRERKMWRLFCLWLLLAIALLVLLLHCGYYCGGIGVFSKNYQEFNGPHENLEHESSYLVSPKITSMSIV